ncbi:MAG TPA: rod shape-determining protein MreD [bacterium]|uniref:Uncharacterized protein n=1 Tax=candidate division TA06 bacterium ADurb.Bin417 TaxID=1852828 RepID=A0A1V5MFJ2_UNCT6|nr:MAG: hypothetical protein BWY73_00964 [candidate division TA06 bacterium ADurb.Bin417]HNQ35297.1 rod shape-determining protein MreD [bacterium]HNS48619.1 rod shape-determining protein MreD [bacterium]
MPINPRNFIFVILANFGVQYLAGRYLIIFDTIPDLNLLLVLYLSFHFVDATGLMAAFALGIFHDLVFRYQLGSHSLVYVAIAYLANRAVPGRFELTPAKSFILCFYFAFLFAIGYEMLLPPAWGAGIFWKHSLFAFYSSAWSLPAFFLYELGFQQTREPVF